MLPCDVDNRQSKHLNNVVAVDTKKVTWTENGETQCTWGYSRGLQCVKLNGKQKENDRYLEKNYFLLFAKCLKMYSFFRICILRLQKVLL